MKTFSKISLFCCLFCLLVSPILAQENGVHKNQKPRTRDIGLKIGILPTGPLNMITDVSGVRVGHTTIIRGKNIRTGVTAILPHGGNLFQEKGPRSGFRWKWFWKTNRFYTDQRTRGNRNTNFADLNSCRA